MTVYLGFNKNIAAYTFPYDWLQLFHGGTWVESVNAYFVDNQTWAFEFPPGTAEGGLQKYQVIDPVPPVFTPKRGLTAP